MLCGAAAEGLHLLRQPTNTWTPKKRVCRHRWWPGQRVCKLCGAAAEGLHLLGRPNGTLEPPRKEFAGTGGGQGSAFASCVEPLRRVYALERGQTAHLNPQEKSLPAQVVARTAHLQAVWSRSGRFTPFKAAKRHTWTPKKRVCPHRWWPQPRVCKLCGAAAEGLHRLGRPNGTLEPPRKESAGTGGGQGSAFASCVEPLRRVYTF